LFSRCLAAGAELFPRIIGQIVRGEPLADMPQDLSRRRLYRHRDALDGRIDWNDSARRVVDFVRAGNYEPLTSPTYVARLDAIEGFEVEVLRASVGPVADGEPGTVIDIADDGPLIVCGQRDTVRIMKARRGRQAMGLAQWRDYLSHLRDRRLLGRKGAER
jgi:methionyl-tRNA formyltransferase